MSPRVSPGWYLAIGLFNLGLYILLGAGFVKLGMTPPVAGVAAYIPCLAISYFGHKTRTFASAGEHRREAPRFLVMTAAGLALSAGLPHAAQILGMPAAIGFAAVAVIIPVVNFFVMKAWIFTGAPQAEVGRGVQP